MVKAFLEISLKIVFKKCIKKFLVENVKICCLKLFIPYVLYSSNVYRWLRLLPRTKNLKIAQLQKHCLINNFELAEKLHTSFA